MGEVRQIHPKLIEMYDRVRDRATVMALEVHGNESLEDLIKAQKDNGVPPGYLDIRGRAWMRGTNDALEVLIEANTPGRDDLCSN